MSYAGGPCGKTDSALLHLLIYLRKKVFVKKKGLGGKENGVGVSSSSTTVAVGVAEPTNDQLDYNEVFLRLLSADEEGGDEGAMNNDDDNDGNEGA